MKKARSDEKRTVKMGFFTVCQQLGIGDIEDYKRDKEHFFYNKLCLIKVENMELLLSYLGEDFYLEHLGKALCEIYHYLEHKDYKKYVNAYLIDHSTFALAGRPDTDQALFLKVTEKLHKNFQYIKPERTDAPILVRFVVVLDRPNMVECAMEELQAQRNLQKHYIVCDGTPPCDFNMQDELDMISVMHWAIQNDKVVPYYQGIYSNKKRCIDKYEALMRIVDERGRVHFPDEFMELAKKYHMYAELSGKMIERVMRETKDKGMEISVNLSAYDINSEAFREKLFRILDNRDAKIPLVLEVLEDEAFKDVMVLKQFVDNVERYGVKIAIDDFGSGYSNLLEIAEISPHYIKIEGNLIRKITEAEKNKVIVESIVLLAEKIGALTIAEYVENEEIQQCVEKLGIDFSQGYYFSVPRPIEKLGWMRGI